MFTPVSNAGLPWSGSSITFAHFESEITTPYGVAVKRVLLLTGVLALIAACDLIEKYREDGEVLYVLPGVLNMREGPSTRQAVVRRLERGQELTVRSRQAPWLSVRMPDDTVGWVHSDYVGRPADVRASFQRDLPRNRTSPRPTPSPRKAKRDASADDPTRLGLTAEEMTSALHVTMELEELDTLEGLERWMGAAGEGQLVVDYWGDPDNLTRASLMVSVLNVSEADLDRNATAALGFVQTALPGLDRDVAWMRERLQVLSSKDAGEGALKMTRRQVTFQFLKALGSVRVTVEVPSDVSSS